ncbi:hypothetical protein ABKN59_001527 [Abortiporus biennis]
MYLYYSRTLYRHYPSDVTFSSVFYWASSIIIEDGHVTGIGRTKLSALVNDQLGHGLVCVIHGCFSPLPIPSIIDLPCRLSAEAFPDDRVLLYLCTCVYINIDPEGTKRSPCDIFKVYLSLWFYHMTSPNPSFYLFTFPLESSLRTRTEWSTDVGLIHGSFHLDQIVVLELRRNCFRVARMTSNRPSEHSNFSSAQVKDVASLEGLLIGMVGIPTFSSYQ